MVKEDQGRQLVGFRGGAGLESLGGGLFGARALFVKDLRLPVGFCEGSRRLLFSTGAKPISFVRRAGGKPHAVFYLAGHDR